MKEKFKILIPDRLKPPADIEAFVFGENCEVILCEAESAYEIPDSIWSDCDAVLAWHEIKYDFQLLTKMKCCKVIVRVGVGFDNVDIDAAAGLGITVCNVPDYGTDDVADHTLALMLSLSRGLNFYNKAASDGIWKWECGPQLRRLKGSTLGIVGLGRIGTAVALRAKSFGINVCFYDPYKPYGFEKALSIERKDSLMDMAESSDIVSIHAPLTSETERMISKSFFEASRDRMIFINTARGAIVDMDALHDAMLNEKVSFAGMDVLPVEPPDESHPLIQAWKNNCPPFANRILITPHCAFFNQQSFSEMRHKAAEEALRVLSGQKPKYQVLL